MAVLVGLGLPRIWRVFGKEFQDGLGAVKMAIFPPKIHSFYSPCRQSIQDPTGILGRRREEHPKDLCTQSSSQLPIPAPGQELQAIITTFYHNFLSLFHAGMQPKCK